MKNLFYMAFAMTFTSLPVGAFEMTETGKFQSIVTVKAKSEVLLIDIFPLTQCVEKTCAVVKHSRVRASFVLMRL